MTQPIEFLAWDSNFFGRRVGKLHFTESIALDGLLEIANNQKYDLLYIYSSTAFKEPSIGQFSLLDVGGHVTYIKNIYSNNSEKIKNSPWISEHQGDSLYPELLEIAFLSGHLSRFRIDHALPAGSFERLYEIWLTETLRSRPKGAVYTYNSGTRAVGLISAKWNLSKCTIGLLAVKQLFQGCGIGTDLIKHVNEVCTANRVTSIEVRTQLSNTAARGLYLNNSFVEHDRSFLYHAHRIR
jgi:dTDP-4-amino-4,6-dideoxy-D-galactose acyltransferase